MIRKLLMLCTLTSLATGCAGAIDQIEKGTETIKEEADKLENSNLKDCKDDEGNPLPKWLCKKDQESDQ